MNALLTLMLIGSCMVAVIALHLRLTTPPPEPVTIRTTHDIDAEFFRIIDREQLWDFWPTR